MTIYRGLLGPPGPETPKKSEKISRASGPPRESEKVLKSSRKTFSRLFPDSWEGLRARGPERFFSDSFGVSGPEGPREPCKWSTASQDSGSVLSQFLGILEHALCFFSCFCCAVYNSKENVHTFFCPCRAIKSLNLVTQIAATSKSEVASDCNRSSKKSLQLRKHPLKPTLWTRAPPVLPGFYSVSEASHRSGNPPEIVATTRVWFRIAAIFWPDVICDCDTAILLWFLRDNLATSELWLPIASDLWLRLRGSLRAWKLKWKHAIIECKFSSLNFVKEFRCLLGKKSAKSRLHIS